MGMLGEGVGGRPGVAGVRLPLSTATACTAFLGGRDFTEKNMYSHRELHPRALAGVRRCFGARRGALCGARALARARAGAGRAKNYCVLLDE